MWTLAFDYHGPHAAAQLRGDARGRDVGVRQELAAGVKGVAGPLAARFRTIQGYPKDLRALPGHPEPAVSWHSGF
jgi:hypothetical protein